MIAILMSTYNGKAYLQEQLRSVLEQTVSDFLLLIRDDGSSDGTVDLLREISDPRVRLILGENLGPAGSFFALLDAARQENADFVFFCDQDDVWMPDKLETLLSEIAKCPAGPALVFSDFAMIDGSGSVTGDSYTAMAQLRIPADGKFFRDLTGGKPAGSQQLLFAAFQIQRSNRGICAAIPFSFGDQQMGVAHGSKLGQMGHAQDLLGSCHTLQLFGNFLGSAAGNTGVNLVKNQGIDLVLFCQNILHGQHDSCQLTAGGNLAHGFQRFTHVGRHIESNRIGTKARQFQLRKLAGKLNLGHVKLSKLC